MSPWLFNVFMDGVVREIKAKTGNLGVEMSMDNTKWKINTMLFADDSVLLAELYLLIICRHSPSSTQSSAFSLAPLDVTLTC